MHRKYLIAGGVLITVFVILYVRVLSLQRMHFEGAEGYLREANYKLALREYDAAMHFYSPLSPYQERAARRLWQMAGMFESEGKSDWAKIALSSIRSSYYASRSLFTPGKDWIKRCDERLAALDSDLPLGAGSLSGSEKERFSGLSGADKAPRVLWSLLAVAGFAGWAGAALFMIFKGLNNEGKVRGRQFYHGGICLALSFSLWVLALIKA